MQREPADAATAEPRFGRVCLSGPFAADVLVGTVRMPLPLRMDAESSGDDLIVRYGVAGHPEIAETVVLPEAAAVIGPALRRLLAAVAVALACDGAA